MRLAAELRPDPLEKLIDREFVTSAKKIANFNEFSEIKKFVKIRKKIR